MQTEPALLEKTERPWVGLDIGGANIKAAHTSGWSKSIVFPMWKQWQSLAGAIAALLAECPAFCGMAVTMTGELADCFATRAEGVAKILEQLTSLVPASMVRVYSVDGQWRSVSQAARDPWNVAASNWHGLATLAASYMNDRNGLLIDVGSTTTDIIPIANGQIALNATTDSQRLQCGGLVYTGVERSNVVGLIRKLTLFGSMCPVINEQFATARDVYLWLREIEEEPDCRDTADNQPATREYARFRLARVVGEDGSTLADSDIESIAVQIHEAQVCMVSHGIAQMTELLASRKKSTKSPKGMKKELLERPMVECIVLSGHGDFLVEAALARNGWDGTRISLRQKLGVEMSRCAPAYAIALLASRIA